jgi:hypothetical protein
VFLGVRQALFDPRDIEKNATMRAATPITDFAHDAARDVVAGEQLGRATRGLVALRVAPALLFAVGCLCPVVFRDVVEHKTTAIFVTQHTAFSPHAFRHQNAAHTGRPHHAGRMELHEFHVHQLGTGMVGQ